MEAQLSSFKPAHQVDMDKWSLQETLKGRNGWCPQPDSACWALYGQTPEVDVWHSSRWEAAGDSSRKLSPPEEEQGSLSYLKLTERTSRQISGAARISLQSCTGCKITLPFKENDTSLSFSSPPGPAHGAQQGWCRMAIKDGKHGQALSCMHNLAPAGTVAPRVACWAEIRVEAVPSPQHRQTVRGAEAPACAQCIIKA